LTARIGSATGAWREQAAKANTPTPKAQRPQTSADEDVLNMLTMVEFPENIND
jgi:hypothetical protein